MASVACFQYCELVKNKGGYNSGEGFSAGSGIRKGWFSNTSFTTGLKTLPTFRPDALVFFRAKMTRASGRNVGKVFNPVVKLVLENQPFRV